MSCYIKFWIQKHLSLLTQVKNFHGAQWGLPSWAIDESLFTEKTLTPTATFGLVPIQMSNSAKAYFWALRNHSCKHL